jgi:5-methylcytosine-specific restriction endonuclease McrA
MIWSTIHSGKRKKAVPAKPRKRKKVEPIKVFRDGREKCQTSTAWNKRREEVWERDDHQCVACWKKLPQLDDAEIDHIRKRSLGRDDRPSNLRTLCPPCHRKRHNQ